MDHSLPTVNTRKSKELDAYLAVDRIFGASGDEQENLDTLDEILVSFCDNCAEDLLAKHRIRVHCALKRGRFFENVMKDVIMMQTKEEGDVKIREAIKTAGLVQDVFDRS